MFSRPSPMAKPKTWTVRPVQAEGMRTVVEPVVRRSLPELMMTALVSGVGAWEVGGGLPGAGDSLRFGEGGVAEAYLREIALGELDGAVVDFCLAAHDDDGVFVDHGEVVEGSDEGLNPTVLVEADLAGGVEGAGELGECLEAFAAVGLFGGDFVVLGALGGHSAVGLMTMEDGDIDVAEFA